MALSLSDISGAIGRFFTRFRAAATTAVQYSGAIHFKTAQAWIDLGGAQGQVLTAYNADGSTTPNPDAVPAAYQLFHGLGVGEGDPTSFTGLMTQQGSEPRLYVVSVP